MQNIWTLALAFWMFWFPQVVVRVPGPGGAVPSGGGSSPTLVQMTGTNSPTNSIAFGSNVTSGNAIIAAAFCGSSATCVIAFSSTHETWPAPETVALSTDGDVMGISCVAAAGTQTDTISATGDGSAGKISSVIIVESSHTSCTLDTTTSPTGGYVTQNSTAATIVSGNITTTSNNDLRVFVAGAATGGGAAYNWTTGSGFSNLGCNLGATGAYTCAGATSNNPYFGLESGVLTTAGTTSAAITTGRSGSIEYANILAAFKAN